MMLVAPIFLAALALIVPVIITFLVRRRRQVIRVPSTMVWRLGARSVAKNRRVRDLRRLLALLACVLGVAALVVAAARPTGRRADATIYVVDVSASMGTGALDEARRWLIRDVATKGANARIAVVTAGAEARVLLPPSPPGPGVDEAIRKLVVEREAASMDEALALAEGLASTTMARVIVLSDRAIEAEVSRRSLKAEARVFGRAGGKDVDNVGITGLFTRTPPDARDDEEREASVTLATSSRGARRARFMVDFGGRRLADRRVTVPERGEITERVTLRGGGHLVARIESDDGRGDALAIDDEASLDETMRRPPRVALIRTEAESTAAFFVARAIRAAGVTDLVEANAEGPAPERVEIAVVLHDGRARTVDVPSFFIGAPAVSTGLAARAAPRAQMHVRSVASEDPILRGVALDEVTMLAAQVAAPLPAVRTLVDIDAGPVLVVGGAGSSSWVWLGIDPEASDLVLRVGFPVLVSNVLAHLGGGAQIVSAKTVPRTEVMFEATEPGAALPPAAEPRWKIPAGPSLLLAVFGAMLLALEAWLSFRKRWAT